MQWFLDARFGMFIHWGPVSLTGKEIGWSRGTITPAADYDALHKEWNPHAFDADAWAKLAADAGALISRKATIKTSSTCEWDNSEMHTRLVDDSQGAVEWAFHTDLEQSPWVEVDLGIFGKKRFSDGITDSLGAACDEGAFALESLIHAGEIMALGAASNCGKGAK